MRVAMMTLNVYDNYGNMLQKYALYRTLKKFADSVEVLWHPTTKQFYPYKLELDYLAEGNLRDAVFTGVRQNKIKEFNDANICTRFDVPYLEDLDDEYDFFIIGSDQVWNPDFNVPGRFLEFVSPQKRIAYAASIAISELPEEVQETYRQGILNMSHVSVREKDGCDLVEKLTGIRPSQTLDPVFLLTADEWRKIEKKPLWLDKKIYKNGYLMTYFLGGNVPNEVKTLAKELGLPMINMLDKNNFDHYVTGVEEFLYLIDHANFVCVQSFHGTAFATIFGKPFIVYRVGKAGNARFSRVESLLEIFNLADRATDADLQIKVKEPLKIDFTRCDEILPLERKESLKFLTDALWR